MFKSLPCKSDKLNQTQIATLKRKKKTFTKNNKNAVYKIISFFPFLNLPLLTTIDGKSTDRNVEQKNQITEAKWYMQYGKTALLEALFIILKKTFFLDQC